MNFNRLQIGRFLLVTLVTLLIYSFSTPGVLQKEFEFEKETVKVQIQENFDDPHNNLLRSSTEAFSVVFKLSADYDFVSFESFYKSIVQVQLAQLTADKDGFKSQRKIYLHFLKLLI